MSRAEPSGIAALLTDYRDYAGSRLWAVLLLMLAHCDRVVAIREGTVEESGDPTYLGA